MILQNHVLSFQCNNFFKMANLKAISSSATLIVSASAVSGGNEFHSGMVRTMVDLHNGECWSLPDSLCSFLLCEVLVTRAGDLRSNSSGDILKCPFRSL